MVRKQTRTTKKDYEDERLRIVQTVAAVIRKNNLSKIHDSTSCPPSKNFFKDGVVILLNVSSVFWNMHS